MYIAHLLIEQPFVIFISERSKENTFSLKFKYQIRRTLTAIVEMYLMGQHPSVIHKAWLAVDPQRAFSGDTYRDVRGTPPLWAVRALSAIFLTVRSLRCPRRG